LLRLCQSLFQLADAGEVFVEFITVAPAHRGPHGLRLLTHRIKDALTVLETAHLRLDVLRPAFNEQLGEHTRWPVLRRHGRTAMGPPQGEAFPRKRQAGILRLTLGETARGWISRD